MSSMRSFGEDFLVGLVADQRYLSALCSGAVLEKRELSALLALFARREGELVAFFVATEVRQVLGVPALFRETSTCVQGLNLFLTLGTMNWFKAATVGVVRQIFSETVRDVALADLVAMEVLQSFHKSVSGFPVAVRDTLVYISDEVQLRFPLLPKEQCQSLSGAFFFLHFATPTFASPFHARFVDSQPEGGTLKMFVGVAKLLQAWANALCTESEETRNPSKGEKAMRKFVVALFGGKAATASKTVLLPPLDDALVRAAMLAVVDVNRTELEARLAQAPEAAMPVRKLKLDCSRESTRESTSNSRKRGSWIDSFKDKK